MVIFIVLERDLSNLKSIVLEDAIFNMPEKFPLFLVIKLSSLLANKVVTNICGILNKNVISINNS